MRVQSDHPCKNGGWLHPISNTQKRDIPRPAPRPVINSRQLIEDWSRATKEEWLERFSKQIGMTTQSLLALNCCWASPYKAWAFPMFQGDGQCVGIRLRSLSGSKWSVPGSHQGLFIPKDKWDKMLVVTEGPTDCAAALDLGYWACGRPSCSGGVTDLCELIKRRGVRRCVIISDNDSPGILGAKMLSQYIGIQHCLLILPAKDVRKFVQLGGTRGLIEDMINKIVWTVPR